MQITKNKYFTLRTFKKKDESSLAKNINSKLISKNKYNIPHPFTIKDAKKYIHNALDKKNKKKIKIVIDINDEVAGVVGISNEGHKACIGYWLAEKYWGQGIMSKVIKEITKHAFKVWKFSRVYAHVFPHNKASMRVLEKNGYQLEGVLRKRIEKSGKLYDSYLYAKVR